MDTNLEKVLTYGGKIPTLQPHDCLIMSQISIQLTIEKNHISDFTRLMVT